MKTESADSSIEDEDFIRKQIMGMGDEEEMSLSEDDKNKAKDVESNIIVGVDLDNTKLISESEVVGKEEDGDIAKTTTPFKTDVQVPEVHSPTLKKAIPALRQRQSTEEEVESITESLSKGSSSVHVSSFTPRSSPTSASSLEEDSDSSPSHKKVSGDKQYRKGKHRQQTQPLPTIEDSSEDERMKDEEKPKKSERPTYTQAFSSSTEDLKEVMVMDDTTKTSGSEFSASIESEPDARQAVQRGRKPSPTVIPFNISKTESESMSKKSLKSAEETYEEIIQKTKAIPGESPPDIEPLYGGMTIEDYLYESLVEETEQMQEFQDDALKQDTEADHLKKLRSPEEVYEEMMQKKKELMMIEQEFQEAKTALDTTSSGPEVGAESCVVVMPTEERDSPNGTEASNEMQIKKKKRPAPPRPSEPPKRPDVYVLPTTHSGSIGFVRPMVPQDPALMKALFPIPDLKITQCSSGEEEDDSLADEYGVGVSSDITPSDDSETKEEPSSNSPSNKSTDFEPISVVCEIPEPKPIPTPISAPELTNTPSPVSPASPPTSPATPDSSLASNATSSSSFPAQTPLSSDSTPLSTPTLPSSLTSQIPSEILTSTEGAVVPISEEPESFSPTSVVVTIPDVVYDPSKPQPSTVEEDPTLSHLLLNQQVLPLNLPPWLQALGQL
ncbi:uncharacterized protein ACB057_005620 [Neosynchiropus ocellatus]